MGDAADDAWEAAFLNEFDSQEEEDPGYDIPGKMLHETEKAILWEHSDSHHADVWIPKSQVLVKEEDNLKITTWLAVQKGYLDDDDDEEIPF